MKRYRTEQLRNVGFFGHGGAGKTSLAEAMLFDAGAITRLGRVDEGTTTSDFDPDEIRRRISISLSVIPVEWDGAKLNVLDTPGYADFVGEVKEAVRVADGALFLVDAVAGVEVGTELTWKYVDERQLPRMILVNKIDRENADFYRTVERLQSAFGLKCVPIQMPVGSQSLFDGVIDLIRMKAFTGAKSLEGPIPADLAEQAALLRDRLVEVVAETDDELITKYLEGEEIAEEEIIKALQAGTVRGQIVPILTASALLNKAIFPVMSAIVDYLPSPVDRGAFKSVVPQTHKEESIEPSVTAPLAALVFKTLADPYVGKLTFFRLYSGTISSDSHVWNATKSRDERIGQLFTVRGKAQEPTQQLEAGDIGAVAKLAETNTGDTLCAKDHPMALEAINFPHPLFSAAIQPKTKADMDKLGPALARIVEEDPSLSVHRDPDTAETIVSGTGESHIDVSVEKMRRKFGVDVKTELPTVSYKETITAGAKAEYKHKKQTGGHGQYGHVFLEFEQRPRGSGFEFADKVVGGSVPKNFIPAVEKGVHEALSEGVLAGYPVVDMRVTLYDGSYHPVDSSEMAFKLAASQAFKKGMSAAKPVLLEPIMTLQITVPEHFTGDVIGDLNTRRARVQGMIPEGGVSVIDAQAPLSEVRRYATELRSITQGRGTFTMEFGHYEEVPAHAALQVIAEAKAAKEQV
ncbi:MAG: elongation factor G [Dehalococcoidia bacterium]|nr:elongation factor G [Dehalococcoidia bacterium]